MHLQKKVMPGNEEMKEFEFTLKFNLMDSSIEPDSYLEHLEKEGCDDALIGVGQKKRIALQFNRESENALEAIVSAIMDVERAIPDVRFIEATPDLVGLTDIAEILNFSRQNIRKLMLNNISSFPLPVHEGKTALWHLFSVLLWLKKENRYSIDQNLVDVAEANMQLNFVREASNLNASIQKTMPQKNPTRLSRKELSTPSRELSYVNSDAFEELSRSLLSIR